MFQAFLFLLDEEGIFNCLRYLEITLLEQNKSCLSNCLVILSSDKGVLLFS